MVRPVFGILLCLAAMSGCAVHVTHKDHDLIRSTLLDLYTNQILDNLIRTANGLPIIHLDYNNAATQVTIINNIGGNESQVTTASNMFALPAAALTATRSIMTTWMGNLGNMNSNQVSLTATPVTNSNDVYDAYISYLDAEKNPGSLMVTCDPPKPGTAHLCKKFDGQYYWVPIEYRKLFFQLALSTTAQRGKAVQAPDKFYTVTLKGPPQKIDNPTFPGTGWVLIFDVAEQMIPIDQGYLTVDSDKDGTQFPIQTTAAAASPGSVAPTVATQLRVTVPHDDLDLQLGDENEPVGRKNLLYVSQKKDKKLRFVFFDGNGQSRAFDEDDLPDKKSEIRGIKRGLDIVRAKGMTKDQKSELIDRIRQICNYYPNAKLNLFSPLSQTGKVFLREHAPTVPSTEDALNRVNFLLQQIQFNQLRLPNL